MGLEREIKNQKAKNNLLKNKGEKQKVYSLIKNYEDNHDGDIKGEQFTKCSKCGKEFEQEYVPDRNVFTDWKTCKECRKLLSEEKGKKVKKKEKEVSVAQLHYDPFPWQIEAAEAFETHRFQVLSCGNRSGYLPSVSSNWCRLGVNCF